MFDIPVNPLHKRLYLADREVAAKERDTYKVRSVCGWAAG